MSAAYDVFADKGFTAATVEDVCDAAGFTRGAFYSNFESMDELFFALWNERTDAVIANGVAMAAEAAEAPHSIEDLIDSMTLIGEERRKWFLVNTEFLLYAMRNTSVAVELTRQRKRYRAQIGPLIQSAVQRSGRQIPEGVDLDTVARLVIAASEGSLHQSLIEPRNANARRLEGLLFQALLFGLAEPESAED